MAENEDTTVEADALRKAVDEGSIDSQDPANVEEATDGE